VEADFSIELAPEDETLEFPWFDPEGRLHYYDLKRHPEYIDRLDELQNFPELRAFLARLNSSSSAMETAKCDAWFTAEMAVEDEIFSAACKCACYVDLLFSDGRRFSFPEHQRFAEKMTELLKQMPEVPAAAELLLRRCYYRQSSDVAAGFYFTTYLFGYGEDAAQARQHWATGAILLADAIAQTLSKAG